MSSATDLHIAPERSYEDFAAMAKKEASRPDGIDVVAIVTPNHLHHAPARAFLEAGIHVICDKPLTTSLEDALDLERVATASGLVFGVTHTYTGYPLVRQARGMVAAGELGAVRVVQVEYAQDWLATKLEATGQKQADWRTDPKRSGAAGCVGDIGTHAFNLAEFVSGLRAEQLAADLTSFVPGRALDDNAGMLLRFAGGARGMLWSSQVAVGNENGLRLRVFGEKASLDWAQEQPNALLFTPYGEPPRLIRRNGAGTTPVAAHASRHSCGPPRGLSGGVRAALSRSGRPDHRAPRRPQARSGEPAGAGDRRRRARDALHHRFGGVQPRPGALDGDLAAAMWRQRRNTMQAGAATGV